MAPRATRDAKRKKNGKKPTAPILRRSENDADNPSERDARAERASTRASAREVADLLATDDIPERDLRDLSPLTPPARSTNDGRSSINGSNDLRDRRSQIGTDDHYRSTVGATDHRDRGQQRGGNPVSEHGSSRSQRSTGRSERFGMQSGGQSNASVHNRRGVSGPEHPGPLSGSDVATVTRDQILAWDMEHSMLVNVTLPYVGTNGRTLEWNDHSNRLQITKPTHANRDDSTMPTSIAPIDRSTPTSEPLEDRTRATRWLRETDQSINMALRRLAKPTPEVGETPSEHRARRAAHSRIQDISDDIEDAEREHCERRARLARANDSLVKEEEEVAHRMRGLTDEQSRTQDRDRMAHYLDWLNSQAVLDRMREADIQQSGHSGIPPREKRAGYPGMNRAESEQPAPAPVGDGPPSDHDDDEAPSSEDDEAPSSEDDSRRNHPNRRLGNPDRPSQRMMIGRGRRREPFRRPGREGPPSDPSSPSSETTESSSSNEDPPTRRRRDDSRESSHHREHRSGNNARDYREQPVPRQAAPKVAIRHPVPIRAGTVDPSILLSLHEEVMINCYRELVRQRVGQTNESFVKVRGIKVNTPKTYDGTDDVSMFEEWLNAVLRTLRVINMCGPAKDAQHIDYCGIVLSGQASMWFQDEVESPFRLHPEWEFEDVICAIFKQFIHDVTAQTAEAQYEAITYDPLKGALAVYNEMKRISRRMAEIPNEYTFKLSFIKRLPWEIVEPLRRYRRVSAETTPLDILLQHVKEVELDNIALSTMMKSRKTAPSTRPSTGQGPPNNGRPQRLQRPDTRRAGPIARAAAPDRKDRRPDPTRGAPYRDARPAPDLTKVECFTCHKKGHYSNNCPDNVRMAAARVPEEEDTHKVTDEHEDDPYGSQFETDLEDYEEFDGPMSDRPDEEEVVYMRAMNASHEPEPIQRVYRSSMKKPVGSMARPTGPKGGRTCLALYVEIHGVKAYSLFDSGSTSDSISPDFVRVAKVPIRTLEPPVPLQLGCVGSRSVINFGATAKICVGPVSAEGYLDVVNIDKYDAIIGTPFMVHNKIALDFHNMEITFAGNHRVTALPEGEGEATAKPQPRRQ